MYTSLLHATPNSHKSSTECEGYRGDEALTLREGSQERKRGLSLIFESGFDKLWNSNY
jgi:hypothetical protein